MAVGTLQENGSTFLKFLLDISISMTSLFEEQALWHLFPDYFNIGLGEDFMPLVCLQLYTMQTSRPWVTTH